MKKNQKGFNVVEVLLIVVIIGVIGFIGWYVWNSKKKTDSTYNAASSSQTETTPSSTDSKSATSTQNAENDFVVKELGVKFPMTDSLKGLYYVIGNNGKSAYFSLDKFKGTDCAADKVPQVALTRYTEQDIAADQESVTKEQARKLGDYYYFSAGGQAGCSEDVQTQESATNLRSTILKYLPGALVVN